MKNITVTQLIKFEWLKLLRRKDNLIYLAAMFVPLLYALGIMMKSSSITYHGAGDMDAFTFAQQMYTFIYMLFIFFVLSAYSAASTLKGEIENQSIKLLIDRVGSRKKIYRAKLLSHFLFQILWMIVFIVFAILCYYAFLNNSEIASHQLYSQNQILSDALNVLSIVLLFVLAVNIGMCLSAYFKTFQCVAIFLLLWIVFAYLKSFDIIKILSPLYYAEQIMDNPAEQMIILIIGYMVYSLFLNSVLWLIGERKFLLCDIQ